MSTIKYKDPMDINYKEYDNIHKFILEDGSVLWVEINPQNIEILNAGTGTLILKPITNNRFKVYIIEY